jgi:lysocardiolipin and lysophospholipid acyltransferase
MHGHLYIILKETLKYIPIVGNAMKFYGFIFLSRTWAMDRERFQYRLNKLSSTYNQLWSTKRAIEPMCLVIFPEGTNILRDGRAVSKSWSDKSGFDDMKHALLPRSTGLFLCLAELRGSVEYLYDCTLAYEGIP